MPKKIKDILFTYLYGIAVPLPQHEKKDGSMVLTGENNPIPSSLKDSAIMQPVDIQGHYQKTIQTHAAVSVPASGLSQSAWFDTDGFDKIGITFKNDGPANSIVYVYYSPDGVNEAGFDNIPQSTTTTKKAVYEIGARFVRVGLSNQDTVAHTMNAWIYLKA